MSNKILYCHFSFRRPKGKEYGMFACALYADFEGKKLVARHTKARKLWRDDQHITAIQAYGEALNCLYDWQGKILNAGIKTVLLVTDNSNLTKWIYNPKKYPLFRKTMDEVYEPYHIGNRKFEFAIGLCEPRKSEKSYKFCREELIDNWNEYNNSDKNENKTELDLDMGELMTIDDLLTEDTPTGVGDFKPIKMS